MALVLIGAHTSFNILTEDNSTGDYTFKGSVVSVVDGTPISRCTAQVDIRYYNESDANSNWTSLETISNDQGEFEFRFQPSDSTAETMLVKLSHDSCDIDKPFYVTAVDKEFDMGQRYLVCH